LQDSDGGDEVCNAGRGQPQTEEATDNTDNTDKIDDLEALDTVLPPTPHW